MTNTRLLILQSVGIFLQGVNAQVGVVFHDASLAAILAAAIGAYQFYVQHVGNQNPGGA